MPNTFALPYHNSVSAWWAALRTDDPRLTYPYVMGMMGGVARTVFCSPDCLCAERREVERAGTAAIESMGYRVRALGDRRLPPARFRAGLRKALERGWPVPWFGAEREGLLTGYDERGDLFFGVSVDLAGERREEALSLQTLRDMEVYTVRRSARPRERRSRRELSALIEWVTFARRPPVLRECAAVSAPVPVGVGLAAYEVWAEALISRTGGWEASLSRALRWLDARRAAAAFLREIAGRQRTAFAHRLRLAAKRIEEEITTTWEPLVGHLSLFTRSSAPFSRTARAQAAAWIRRAGELAAGAIDLIEEAALGASHLPAPLYAALLEPPDGPLEGVALQETLYLARAGTRPFRQLAARRLSGARSPQAVSTLAQMLYDPEEAIAETALRALEQSGPQGTRIVERYRAERAGENAGAAR